MKIVTKPWGYENWLSVTDRYVLKEILIKTGFNTSLHYHKVKEETLYILSGRGVLRKGEEVQELTPNIVLHILPNTVHRIRALEDLTMIEASTPEVDDVIRLEDDFNRGNGRIESEHK